MEVQMPKGCVILRNFLDTPLPSQYTHLLKSEF